MRTKPYFLKKTMETARQSRNRDSKDWWVTAFDEKYLKTYIDIVTPSLTELQASFLIEKLGLERESKILDLACGQGRISLELARKGYFVLGCDYSEQFVSAARSTAQREGLEARFIRSDMRGLTYESEFDAVISIFTSFGFFDDADNVKVLRGISRALKPEGKLLIDINNALGVISTLSKEGKKDGRTGCIATIKETDLSNGLKVNIREEWSPVTMRWRMTRFWTEDGKSRQYETDVRLYLLPELKYLMESSGLRCEKVFGDFGGSAFDCDSKRLIIIASKR
jgi:2-polyprenyl-3-methyl-5-hydroxy-6-metoxy-1,4-benzoquinol methylase